MAGLGTVLTQYWVRHGDGSQFDGKIILELVESDRGSDERVETFEFGEVDVVAKDGMANARPRNGSVRRMPRHEA